MPGRTIAAAAAAAFLSMSLRVSDGPMPGILHLAPAGGQAGRGLRGSSPLPHVLSEAPKIESLSGHIRAAHRPRITRNVHMQYVDGFVLPLPKRQVQAYRRIAQRAGKLWREHGALEYRECVGDDLKTKMGIAFPRLAKVKRGETVCFSWIVYKSRAHRDRVNAKVMKDPRMAKMMNEPMLAAFDMKRMAYGGFKVLVDA
jgi:uncharacterized protein YbaA (DUF1428 family)